MCEADVSHTGRTLQMLKKRQAECSPAEDEHAHSANRLSAIPAKSGCETKVFRDGA